MFLLNFDRVMTFCPHKGMDLAKICNSKMVSAISPGFCIQESLGLPWAFFWVPLTELGTCLIFVCILCQNCVSDAHLCRREKHGSIEAKICCLSLEHLGPGTKFMHVIQTMIQDWRVLPGQKNK